MHHFRFHGPVKSASKTREKRRALAVIKCGRSACANRGNSDYATATMMAISRAGRWAIATDGTFSLGYLTFPQLAGKLDIFSVGFCLERE